MKTEVHAPGFHAFAQQTLLNARCRATAVWRENRLYRQTEAAGESLPLFNLSLRLIAAVPVLTHGIAFGGRRTSGLPAFCIRQYAD
jgi:hypothetical protein